MFFLVFSGTHFLVASFKFSNMNLFLILFSFLILKREILENMLTILNKIIFWHTPDSISLFCVFFGAGFCYLGYFAFCVLSGTHFLVVSIKLPKINLFLVFFSFLILKSETRTISNKIIHGIRQIRFPLFCLFSEAVFLIFWFLNFRISTFS